jgi:hypothetical protein
VRKFLLYTGIVLLLAACRKELERPSWEVSMTGPLIHSSLDISDLIPDSLLQVNPDNSITLVYNSTIFSLNPDSLVTIPDTSIVDTFALPVFVPTLAVTPNQQLFTQAEDNRFSVQDVELTDLILRQGTFEVNITSTINQPTEYTYSLPGVALNGTPFLAVITVPPGSIANPAVYTEAFDLSNYQFNLRGSTGTDFNSFASNLIIRMAPASNPTNVTNTDRIIISTSFNDLSPSYAKGYFGSQAADIPSETVSFDLFRKIIDGTIDIDEVDVNLVLRNGIGADARITINQLMAQNSSAAASLSHTTIGNPININRATSNGSGPIPTIHTISLNESNSNIDQVIELLPDEITVDLDMFINPLGNVSGHNDFLYDILTFEADLEVTMPLNIIADDLTLVDTIPISVNKGENGHVKNGTFRIFVSNGFPLGGEIQLYLLDEYGSVVDSIVAPGTFTPAPVNASFIASGVQNSIIEITLTTEQMEKLYNSPEVLLKVVFYTSSLTQHISIYDHYKIDLRMTGNFVYHIGPAQ